MELSNIFISATPDWEAIESELSGSDCFCRLVEYQIEEPITSDDFDGMFNNEIHRLALLAINEMLALYTSRHPKKP